MGLLPAAADRLFSCAVRVNGAASDSLLRCVLSITVDEDITQGSSARVELSACRNPDGSWPYLEDPNLKPWNRITLLVLFPQQTETVFDGYIAQVGCRTHEDAQNMTVHIAAVDASYHMNQEEKARIWRGQHYEDIARSIFEEYKFKPQVADPPPGATPPPQTAQRSTDHAFLRELARRRGYEFYVLGGNAYFRPAQLDGTPQKLIAVNFGEQSNVHQMEFESDGTAATEASLAWFDALEGKADSAQAVASGLAPQGTELLATLRGGVGMPQATRLARGHGFHSGAQAADYATGMLRRHGWWVSARGQLNGLKYGAVLRTRRTVGVKGAGALYNGLYYVRQVQHHIGPRTYQMQFELARNALGELGSENFEGEHPDAPVPAALGAGPDPDPIEVAEDGPRVLPA
jgi:phage protein D